MFWEFSDYEAPSETGFVLISADLTSSAGHPTKGIAMNDPVHEIKVGIRALSLPQIPIKLR